MLRAFACPHVTKGVLAQEEGGGLWKRFHILFRGKSHFFGAKNNEGIWKLRCLFQLPNLYLNLQVQVKTTNDPRTNGLSPLADQPHEVSGPKWAKRNIPCTAGAVGKNWGVGGGEEVPGKIPSQPTPAAIPLSQRVSERCVRAGPAAEPSTPLQLMPRKTKTASGLLRQRSCPPPNMPKILAEFEEADRHLGGGGVSCPYTPFPRYLISGMLSGTRHSPSSHRSLSHRGCYETTFGWEGERD